ncbi:MAG: iron-sulfur cluster assembly protein IscA [Gammaproteobacteria bacterium RIFCSPLOWO2_02_FULL_52_10]|nr:MAG: iron-sulfur cluster assembly protein IscA [Gammaproteobacteria bacterium RIFCSPLOWO2_02_FULL_52_10]OGT85393.1 MAG: iron-sulfur cluster assembly protein IscA [Gammaproteobacteria bacterium RIFCSPLOWO2_12_FULL_52_10]
MKSIDLTDRAADHVRNYLARHGRSIGLRIGVKPTGCSGFKYVVEPAESLNDQDQAFESKGVQIVVDEQSLQYLAGVELDYVREGLNEGFRFNNPNVQETCGCGESFSVSNKA